MAKIELADVNLTFTIHQQRKVSLKEYLVRGLFLPSRNPRVAVHALAGITLSATDGDRIGIIGHNGAGKSTMLKMLAGIYPPSSGSRIVEGRICSLFDIALGFEPDANGWDNIKYRSYLQGETPTTLRGKTAGIAEFSELGDFLNIPVRYYSAGMLIRLAFSIATAIEPEVLLVDEVLSVGDMAFQQKATKRMKEMMATASLMVMVSHDLHSIKNLCTRVLWMEHGKIVLQGDPTTVVSAYQASVARGQATPTVGGTTESDEIRAAA